MRRTFTADEANKLLPQVAESLGKIQTFMRELRDVRDQLADLRIVWEDKIDLPSCPDHEEYVKYRVTFQRLEQQLADQMEAVLALGVEIKDPDIGLVDFYAERDGEPVYLCWRTGEPSVRFWHTLTGGFGARKPIKPS